MNILQKVLARRYAMAYINTFDDQLSQDIIASINHAIPFFKEHVQALYFLTLPTIAFDQKLMIMTTIMRTLQMPVSLDRLLDLLIRHKRAVLWCDTLESIVSCYYEKHHIAQATVESFPELSQEDKQKLEYYFQRMLNKVVLYRYRVQPKIISGLCIKTDNFMWEDSIAKKLRIVRSAVLEPYKG